LLGDAAAAAPTPGCSELKEYKRVMLKRLNKWQEEDTMATIKRGQSLKELCPMHPQTEPMKITILTTMRRGTAREKRLGKKKKMNKKTTTRRQLLNTQREQLRTNLSSQRCVVEAISRM